MYLSDEEILELAEKADWYEGEDMDVIREFARLILQRAHEEILSKDVERKLATESGFKPMVSLAPYYADVVLSLIPPKARSASS